MAAAPKTVPTDASVVEFLQSVAPARRREQSVRLLEILAAETSAEPRMWGSAIVGFGRVTYVTAAGRSGETSRVAFSSRRAALTLYGLTPDGSNADLLATLGRHSVGKGCPYVRDLDDGDLDVLRRLIRPAWGEGDAS